MSDDSDKSVILTFRTSQDVADRIDLATEIYPGRYPDQESALRAAVFLFLRKLDLIPIEQTKEKQR